MNFNQILIHLTLAVIKLIFHIHTDINPYDRSLFILMQHPFSPTEWYMYVNPIKKITEMIFHKQIKACTDPQQIKISSSKDRFLITQKCFSFFFPSNSFSTSTASSRKL